MNNRAIPRFRTSRLRSNETSVNFVNDSGNIERGRCPATVAIVVGGIVDVEVVVDVDVVVLGALVEVVVDVDVVVLDALVEVLCGTVAASVVTGSVVVTVVVGASTTNFVSAIV